MREKPTCSLCSKKFTRNGNMLRHMEDIHKIFKNSFKKNPALKTKRPNFNTIELHSPNDVEKQTPLTPLERTWAGIGEVLKVSSEYMKSLNMLHEDNYLRGQIDLLRRINQELRANNWILPYSAIEGLSGYLCRRCLTFNFIDIQHIGYDKTMYSRHSCGEQKVRTPKDVSTMNLPDLLETWDEYDSAACQMLDKLNLIMPGKKYLIAEDKSNLFKSVESLMHPDSAKILLGVPDRFYFHIVNKEMMSDWLTRVVANMGQKTIVEDFEIRDFLRRVTSTYAIFEIPTDTSPRRILISITD